MQRVHGIDVMFLYADTPAWRMRIATLAVVEPPVGCDDYPDQVCRLLARRTPLAPQFRSRVHTVPFGLGPPVIVEDAGFDSDKHVHRVAVPGPGTPAQLGELVGRLLARDFDHRRPLWEAWVVDGLEGGRYALLVTMHHAVVDGIAGAALAGLLLDPSPTAGDPGGDPADPAADLVGDPGCDPADPVADRGNRPSPEPPPGWVRAGFDTATGLLLTPLRAAGYAAQLTTQGVSAARHFLGGSAAGLPFRTGRSSLNRSLTQRRSLAFVDVPLDDVRRVREAYDVRVNDVILTVVGGALRRYLSARGELPARALVAEVPVSTRTESTAAELGTRVANMFVSLATDVEDPVARLRAVARGSADAKRLQRRLAARKRVDLSDLVPPIALGAVLRAYSGSALEGRVPPVFSLIVSSIRGPSGPLYLAGGRVVGLYPIGPLLYAAGLNVTTLTAGDRIHFGVNVCPDIVPDPWAIADAIPAALAELVLALPTRTCRPRRGTVARRRGPSPLLPLDPRGHAQRRTPRKESS